MVKWAISVDEEGFPNPFQLRTRLHITIAVSLAIILGLAMLNLHSLFVAKNAKSYASSIEDAYDSKNRNLDTQLNSLNSNLAQLEDKYYEDKLTQIMSKEKLAVLAKDAWNYTLTVNGDTFKEDNISTSARNISIVLTETKDSKKPLPSSIIDMGSITGTDKSDKFSDHLMLQTTAPYEKKVTTDGGVSKAVFTLNNVPAGTIITLNLSEPLKERLKINDNMLEVISK